MAEWDIMKTADSSAINCFYGRHSPTQPAALLHTPNHPLPLGPIKVEDPSVQECIFLPDWQLKEDLKEEVVQEDPFETEAPPASPSPAPPCASSAQLAALRGNTEINTEGNRNLTNCLHCNTIFNCEESLSHHVLSVHGKATNHRPCHLCSDAADVIHDDFAREMHMLLKHGLKTFRCSLCGFIEFEMAKIARHLSSSHADIYPVNLHKLLSYIERPHCPCNIESWREYLNSSTTISVEEQETQNPSIARSTGGEIRDVGSSR